MAANPIFDGAQWFLVTSTTQVWPLDGEGLTIATLAGSAVETAQEVQFLGVTIGKGPDGNDDIIVYKDAGATVAFQFEPTSNARFEVYPIPLTPLGRKFRSDISAAWGSDPGGGHFYVHYRVVGRTS